MDAWCWPLQLQQEGEAQPDAACAGNASAEVLLSSIHCLMRNKFERLQERARRKKQASKGQQKRLPAVSSVIKDFDEDDEDDDDFDDEDYED